MSDTEPLLAIRELSVAFPLLGRTVHAINGCNLTVESGQIVALVGESGSGKSVTALATLGLAGSGARVSGSIRLAGVEMLGRRHDESASLRGGVAAMIFQNPATALNPYFTVGRQMTDVIRLHRGMDRHGATKIATRCLDDVGLADAAGQLRKYPHQFSGGQLQRVMIAMALACKPQLLIADEPTTALDVTVQAQIIVLLRELAAQTDLAVLFITHDLGVVASLCDRVAVMYAGTVVEDGPVDVLFRNAVHPYTHKLMQTVPRPGTGRHRFVTIDGQVPDLSSPPSGCAFHPRCEHASATCAERRPTFQHVEAGRAAACHHPLRSATSTVSAQRT